MPISPHQINNVLRVYGDQLCQSKIADQTENSGTGEPERIGISARTRQETIIDGIASNIIKRITQSQLRDNLKAKIINKLGEHKRPEAIHKKRRSKLIFKKVDENAETLNSLTIENAKFLIHILRIIIKKT